MDVTGVGAAWESETTSNGLDYTTLLRIRHSYSRKIVTNKRCDYCNKSMFLFALRCKDCRFKCHRKCAQNASPRCVLNLPGHKFRASSKPRQQSRPKNRAVQLARQAEPPYERLIYTPSFTPSRHREGLSLLKQCQCPTSCGLDATDIRRASDCDACKRLQASPPDSPKYTIGVRTRYSLLPPYQDFPGKPDMKQDCGTARQQLEDLSDPSKTDYHGDPVISTPKRPLIKTQWVQEGTWSNVSSMSCGYYSSNSECSSEVFQAQEEDSACLCSSGYGQTTVELSRTERHRKWSRGERSKTVDATVTRKRDTDMGKSLIATWPPHGHSNIKAGASPESLDDAHRMCDSLAASKHVGVVDHDIREAVKEWWIPNSDLKYGMCLRAGRNGSTYRGNWHGEVLIHTRRHVEDVDAFLEEVSVLSMIRHENIALFMGACIDPPNLAIVTCVQKGPSLFQHLHIKQSKSPMHSRIHIARQIAQGMGYLHARGIVVGDLNTKAIFLESKVKLCLTGYDTTDGMCDREDYATVPQGHLTYIAPEILRTMRVQPPYVIEAEPHTIESDVYAFGTVLYELLTSQWPFASTFACTDSVIYRVCNGKRASLAGVKCVPSVKSLVEDCWSHEPTLRPTFQEIVEELNQNAALVNMKHSLSEPDLLNRVGRPW
ncbi:kinase suppressor of Ras 1-like isoform X2 [Acanthaster planci]|uniref:Kinase suppressor of Ras 1-like isoform X2 n=1 Tax=Acanthaster planci TaxID=133434 RepID=A0A8B7ZJM8_ACAPL|nr:kinase suppressor of Ras 1-like isoform X2 [Acanthaster planci]